MKENNKSIIYEGVCYVLLRLPNGPCHPITHVRHDLLWYPETGMCLVEQAKYIPYVKSIVTESPWLISAYSTENVRVWDKKRGWIWPNEETYGASVNRIVMKFLGIRQTIAGVALDGGKQIDELIKEMASERV